MILYLLGIIIEGTFLLRRGFLVSSFEILDCPCKEKGGIIDGV